MSLPAKITLGAACVVSIGTIGYVHVTQQMDRNRLHEGVIRDVERQQRRKMENIVVLQQQIDLTKQLRGDTKFQEELVSS